MNSIRNEYKNFGVKKFYEKFGKNYINPHSLKIENVFQNFIENSKINFDDTLDFSAGSGLITKILQKNNFKNLSGSDPYTFELFTLETNLNCLKYSFDDVLKNGLNRKYKNIISCYALHLCEKSKINNLLYQFSRFCTNFIIISPNKKPKIDETFFKIEDYFIKERIHVRWLNSRVV